MAATTEYIFEGGISAGAVHSLWPGVKLRIPTEDELNAVLDNSSWNVYAQVLDRGIVTLHRVISVTIETGKAGPSVHRMTLEWPPKPAQGVSANG